MFQCNPGICSIRDVSIITLCPEIHADGIYFLIYAFKPTKTGLPSTSTSIWTLPPVLATISVLPDEDGFGFSKGIRITSGQLINICNVNT